MTDQQITTINRAHSKKTKLLYKNFYKDRTSGLALFIEYLKYIRDLLVLESSQKTDDKEIQTKITTLTIAVAEFDAYSSYLTAANSKQKAFHWSNFCELIKQNMEEWLE